MPTYNKMNNYDDQNIDKYLYIAQYGEIND